MAGDATSGGVESRTWTGWVETIVENFLWNFRLIIFLGVMGLLISSAVVFVMGILETIGLAKLFVTNIEGLHLPKEVYDKVIVTIITTVDDFLLGIVLLIFSLGTYDLFISRIDPAEQQDDIRPDWLVFTSLDELKAVLGKVVLMILTINFLRIVVHTAETFREPVHLLYLGGGISLVALAINLSHGRDIDETTMAWRLERQARERGEEPERRHGGERRHHRRRQADPPRH